MSILSTTTFYASDAYIIHFVLDALMTVAIIGAIWQTKHSNGKFQFSLRTLLIVMTAFSLIGTVTLWFRGLYYIQLQRVD
jgi:hypothetical protein